MSISLAKVARGIHRAIKEIKKSDLWLNNKDKIKRRARKSVRLFWRRYKKPIKRKLVRYTRNWAEKRLKKKDKHSWSSSESDIS